MVASCLAGQVIRLLAEPPDGCSIPLITERPAASEIENEPRRQESCPFFFVPFYLALLRCIAWISHQRGLTHLMVFDPFDGLLTHLMVFEIELLESMLLECVVDPRALLCRMLGLNHPLVIAARDRAPPDKEQGPADA